MESCCFVFHFLNTHDSCQYKVLSHFGKEDAADVVGQVSLLMDWVNGIQLFRKEWEGQRHGT